MEANKMSNSMRVCTLALSMAVFGVITLSGCAVLQGCLQATPTRDFQVEALVLDRSAFPGTWIPSADNPSTPSNAPIGGMESIERTRVSFYSGGDIAYQEIHRFTCATRAAREFRGARDREFKEGPFNYGFKPPSELSYHSPSSDQFYLACGTDGVKSVCRAIGQYEEYYVYLNVHMSVERMSLTNLEKMLKEMDRRISIHLRH
jgi:hypothetical protein